MLASYPMEVKDGRLHFPEAIKEPFLETPDLVLRDGRRVTPEEMWQFLTEEAPRRFPYQFTASPTARSALPRYVELLSGLKFHYLAITRRFRIESLRKLGMPLVYVQGGQTLDPYFAAGTVAMRPGYLRSLAYSYFGEGLDVRAKDFKTVAMHEEGHRTVSQEVCHQVFSHASIRKGLIPVDMLAPFTNLRCSDCTFLVESHRDSGRNLPAFLMDYPVNHEPEKGWVTDYVAASLRRLVKAMDELTGRKTTEEDFQAQIKLNNRVRRLAREVIHLCWAAEVPPIDSLFLHGIVAMAQDGDGDPAAAAQVLAEMLPEIKERAENGVKGMELSAHPARIFVSGSCVGLDPCFIDRVGGVVIGWDDRWSGVSVEVAEEGDPYENYARAILSAPYELPTEERAHWIIEQMKQARADGIIFGYQWGCNFQSSISRMVCDIVKKETGLPSLILEMDDLGRGESIEHTRNRIEAFMEMLQTAVRA